MNLLIHSYDGICDKDGCDFATYRMGQKTFYGNGSNFQVNTDLPFTVVTQFLTTDGTANGDLKEIRRFYVQNGRRIDTPKVCIPNKLNLQAVALIYMFFMLPQFSRLGQA